MVQIISFTDLAKSFQRVFSGCLWLVFTWSSCHGGSSDVYFSYMGESPSGEDKPFCREHIPFLFSGSQLVVASLLPVVRPGATNSVLAPSSSVLAPSSDALAPSSFLFLVVRPGAPLIASDRSVRRDTRGSWPYY